MPGPHPAGTMLWEPSAARREAAPLTAFARHLALGTMHNASDYEPLWRWSVLEPGAFWSSVADFYDIAGLRDHPEPLASASMPGAVWFPGTRLNFVRQALTRTGGNAAILHASETSSVGVVSFDELRDQVGRAAAGLRSLGVREGDRVVGILPNIPETVVACLATGSIGAIWSCCSPDFGASSLIERFQQLEPMVLLAVDGYQYGGRWYDRSAVIDQVRAAIPSLASTVVVPTSERPPSAREIGIRWSELLSQPAPLEFVDVPFDHPLWILYSSGTTGVPKALVHGHGGMLLEQLRANGLQLDAGRDDRVFWFCSTGWAVWNMLVGALTVGSSIVLYDGNPTFPDIGRLWQVASEVGATIVGAGAPVFHSMQKQGHAPREHADLGALRTVASTGAPLSLDAYSWVYEEVGSDVMLAPLSGGTDVCSAFIGPAPVLPVYAGEMSCRYLGADVRAIGPAGEELVGPLGELVLRTPLPSMPLHLWGDADGSRYRQSYFDMFPGHWRHGDWIRVTDRGTCIIEGRSDSTLKRSGVRMGTSEFYTVLERDPDVADSLVVDLTTAAGTSLLVLLVVLRPGLELDDQVTARLRALIRTELSPRHVPDRVVQIDDVPRTRTGKKSEVPVRRVLQGVPVAEALSLDALTNPEAMDAIVGLRSLLAG